MKADELREYLIANLGYTAIEVKKLKVAEMRELVQADKEE